MYVVARGYSDLERMFRRRDLLAASAYAKECHAEIEALPCSSVCDSAVRELFGES